MSDTRTYTLGPDNARLTVHTGTAGVAAQMGHDLELTVTSWNATLELTDDAHDERDGRLTLEADGGSLQLTGTSNENGSSDGDAERVKRTIDDRILKHATIGFQSTAIRGDGETLTVDGMLTILGTARPLRFSLAIAADGGFSGEARFPHTQWGIRQYSAMAGTLKVADTVTVRVTGTLPQPS